MLNPRQSDSKASLQTRHFEEVCRQCKISLYWVFSLGFLTNLFMLAMPIYLLQLYRRVIPAHSYETLFYLTLFVFFVLAVLSLLLWIRSRMLARTATWFSESLASPALMNVPDQLLAGDLYGGQTQKDIQTVSQFIGGAGIIALLDAPWSPLFVIACFVLNVWIGLVTLIGAALLFSLGILNESLTRAGSDKAAKASMQNQRFLERAISNAEAIQAMGMMGNIIKKWKSAQAENNKDLEPSLRASNIIQNISRFIRMILQVLILAVGGLLVLAGELSGGGMVVGSILLGRALSPLENSITGWKQLIGARQAFGRLKNHFSKPSYRQGGTHPLEPKGEISVTGVYYTVPGRESPILSNINFKVSPGDVVSIVGRSGSGKTTLARLLSGVIAPVRGSIRMDDVEIFQWDREQCGGHQGYLPQSIEMLPGTVEQNIARLGDVDQEAVVKAALRGHAHELILHLPQGYQTNIGNTDDSLPYGQLQRVGLARALYKDPHLIVLDEPNSNLDDAGLDALYQTIKTLKEEKRTVFIISHLKPLIVLSDKLLMLHDGTQQFFGPTEEYFKQMASRQLEQKKV